MNPSTQILSHVLAASAAILIAGSAAADVPDQAYECLSGSAGNLNLSQPIGQTFKPAQDQLDAVEINLVGFNTQAATVTVTVRETDFSGTVLGAKSETINFVDGVSNWYRFQFDAPLAVTPEATYMLALTVDNNAVGLPYGYCGTYTRGAAWSAGVASEFNDYGFRTFGPCGNGTVEDGEQCDDADSDRPCCLFPSCQFTAGGTQCPTGDLCTNAECNGAGACVGYDGPRYDCSRPAKAVLSVKDSAKPGKDSVKFKWIKGDITAAEAGSPRSSTDYALCVFAGDEALISTTLTPQPAWDDTDYGKLLYQNKEGTVANFTAVSVKFTEAEEDKSSASASLGGESLSLSVMSPLVEDVTAQIITSTGGCWSAHFDGDEIKKNEDGKLVGSAKYSNE